MLDLEAYLHRIGVGADASLTEIHRAHAQSIPFENLDPHRGVAVELDLEALQRKLVQERRGGYCFEHNSLLAAVLEARGAQVERMLGRVRWGTSPGQVNGLTHMVLRVTTEGSVWHADTGFGAATLLEPIPFGPGGPYNQSGWMYRVIEERDELVLQCETPSGWKDVYAFQPRPVELIDIELGNWWVSTRPNSGFVTGLIATTNRADGTRLALSDWSGELEFVTRTPAGSEAEAISYAQVPELLSEHFGLGGFKLAADGRIALA